ncbi:hypothetical protein [Streptomyces canus]|uniref:hypothetical protein n=1 Tax=Streptomyces canus TaxID=58343 RepID=UPI0003679D52|nr:hypothetical protein [Streptomyces canus]
MSRFGREAHGSDAALRRNALLTCAVSVVTLVAGVMMLLNGLVKGWICVGLAVLHTGFVLVATRVRARRSAGR